MRHHQFMKLSEQHTERTTEHWDQCKDFARWRNVQLNVWLPMNLDDDFTGKIIAKCYPWKPTVTNSVAHMKCSRLASSGSPGFIFCWDECTAWFVFFRCQIETKHTDGNARRVARWELSSQCSKREREASTDGQKILTLSKESESGEQGTDSGGTGMRNIIITETIFEIVWKLWPTRPWIP